jgi:hypothetical protein
MKQFITLLSILLLSNTFGQNALNFDGTNDYVQTTFEGVFGTTNRTFEAWVFVDVDAPATNLAITDYGLNAVGSRNTFMVNGGRGLSFISGGLDANIGSDADIVPEGVWTHVAFVLNSGTGYLYMNGIEVGTGSLTTVDTPEGHTDLRIGQRIPGGSILFNGAIDEVRIWNIARTADEILADMNAELCEKSENLVAYYRFNEGTAGGVNTGVTVLPDLIDGNNGDLLNFSLDGIESNWVEGADLPAGFSLAEQDVTLCVGESLVVGESTYTETGEYVDILPSALTGCDSILTTNLTVLDEIEFTQEITLCLDEVLIVGESEYSEAGEYTDILTSATGCDSTVFTSLSYYGEIEFTQSVVLCPGEVLTVGESEYDVAGDYIDVLTTPAGCDSTVYSALTYYEENELIQDIVLCEGESVTIGESTYSEPGEYTDVLVSEVTGCDSTITSTITITILDLSSTTEGLTITSNQDGAMYQWVDCNNDYLPFDGATDQSITVDENGEYAVIVTIGECSDTSECTLIDNVGLDDFDTESNLSLYPNPANERITIQSNYTGEFTVTVYGMLGKSYGGQIYTQNTVELDIHHLPAGSYIILFHGVNDKIERLRFVKQ